MMRMSTIYGYGGSSVDVRTQLHCSLSSIITNKAQEPETSQASNARVQRIRSTMATRVRIKCDSVIVPVLYVMSVPETRSGGIV